MFDLRSELKKWKSEIRKHKHLEDGYVEELESHLIDEYDSQKSKGFEEKEAFQRACKIIGSANEFTREYEKSNSVISSPQPWESKWAYFFLFNNYLKIAYRNIFKSRGYSLINIAGLSVGLACTLLILLWVQDELSFDKFHPHVEDVYRIYSEYPESGQAWQTSLTPDPLKDKLENDYPEIEEVTRTKLKIGTLKYGEVKLKEETLSIVDPSFFTIFDFPLVNGDFSSVFGDPHSVLITETLAHKLFADETPINKTISFDNNIDLIVKGVLRDFPSNTMFTSDMFLPYSYLESSQEIEQGWIGGRAETYIRLKTDISRADLEKKISSLGEDNAPGCGYLIKLQPFGMIHLYSLTGEEEGMYYIYMFSIIALFVLFMACINFMNLSTARSAKRAKEVGLRKVIGASRWQIIKQFYGESFLMVFISGIIAIVLTYLVIPAFNGITEKQMSLTGLGYEMIFLVVALLVATGFLAGSYPALMLSSFGPIKVLRRESEKGLKGKAFRRTLVVVQFSLAVGLILATTIVQQQLTFMQNKSLGFDKENVMYLDLSNVPFQKYKSIRDEIGRLTGVRKVSIASDLPSSIFVGISRIDWEGKDPNQVTSFSFNSIDENYLETFGMDLIEGSNFRGDIQIDMQRFLVNEKAAKIICDDSPVGKRFKMWNTEGEIVGVVKDFHSKPMDKTLDPMLFTYVPAFYKYMFVKIAPYQVDGVISEVGKIWNEQVPGIDYGYKFLDDTLNERYAGEKRIAALFEYFSGFAVFISLLGLIGLVSYTTQQRVKEIGIRKVLGASLPSILRMISKQFVAWIIISNIIALPVTYYIMSGWLSEFANRIEISFITMIGVAVLTLAVSILVITVQSLRSAMQNPVDALKYE